MGMSQHGQQPPHLHRGQLQLIAGDVPLYERA
jgi:hypothetical protein